MVAEHYEIDIDMIFQIKAAQNMVAVHYGRDFNIIFHFKEAENVVALHYEFMKDNLT